MGANSKISWTSHTFNCWWGCTKVGGSPACDHCYAESWAKRTGFDIWGDDRSRRYFGDKHWNEPLCWNKAAEKSGEMARVFCSSMADWAEGRPEQKEHLDRLWTLIDKTDWLTWMMLTKRPQLIGKLCPYRNHPRVWQGTTTETQAWLDLRWEHLKRVESSVYWFSAEPLFEPLKLPADFLALGKRGWVIVGGENSPRARHMDLAWARSIRDQCQDFGVRFHMKQMSGRTKAELEAIPEDLMIREFPEVSI